MEELLWLDLLRMSIEFNMYLMRHAEKGRKLAVVGKSLQRVFQIALNLGYIEVMKIE